MKNQTIYRPASTLSVISEVSFIETERKLEAAIESRGLTLFAAIDHGQGAQSVGQDIGRSKLYIFGNPKAGTPLMLDNPYLGLELPLKMLIHQGTSGEVRISFKDVTLTAETYHIESKDELLSKILVNLSAIAVEASH